MTTPQRECKHGNRADNCGNCGLEGKTLSLREEPWRKEFDEYFQRNYMLVGQIPSPKGTQRIWANAWTQREGIKYFIAEKIAEAKEEERNRIILEVKSRLDNSEGYYDAVYAVLDSLTHPKS